MVLQRGMPIHVWGWSDPGEAITAALEGASQSTTADNLGRWSLYFPPRAAGGPFQMTVAGTNKLVLEDVLVGDVWFASGQSNMEMPLSGFPNSAVVKNGPEEIAHATNPNMRLLLIGQKASPYPLRDFEGQPAWTACTPATAAKFSAVAYFFGREITAREHVPVGLIDSSWGGTPAEAWVSMNGLAAHPSLMPVFGSWARMANEEGDNEAQRAAEKRQDEQARQAGAPPPKHQWHPNPASWDPSWLFNGMVAPALELPIKGVIWYQGESNSSLERAPLYEKLFPALIADWRRAWGEGDFPFLFVQISSFKSSPHEVWPVIREAQLRTLSLANTGMAVTIDVGDPDNVHPADKETVGARLALAARALAYDEKIEYSGPLFRSTSTEAGSIRAWFNHTDDGLEAKNGSLAGFEVAGEDHRFFPATARVDGHSVVANSAQVSRPIYVRYAWENAPPVANLYNAAGLPASPFTSEEGMADRR
jgi:sialate O-acetylesterase